MTDVSTAVSAAFTALSGDLQSMLIALIPTGLGVIGIGIGIRFAVKWIKKLTDN